MIHNFGRNIRFEPQQTIEPKSEDELLQAMSSLSGQRFRVQGAKHAWSPLIPTDDVSVSLKHLNQVRLTTQSNGRVMATVGGGCTIQRLLQLLDEHDLTLPTVGLITSQTIGGCVSTATHGSGRYSLSHYLKRVRLATIDPTTEKATVRTFARGPEMAAARCALGCLGVLIEVQLYCIPQFEVTETVTRVDSLEEVFRLEHKYELQQFCWVPHLDEYVVYARGPSRGSDDVAGWRAATRQLRQRLVVDGFMHLMIVALARIRNFGGIVRWFFRSIYPRLIVIDRQTTDRSDRMLTCGMDWFRHLETEIYVSESQVADAMAFVRNAVDAFADRKCAVSGSFASHVNEAGMTERLHQLRGTWTHHYPILVRRVLPDDSLLSMSAGTEPTYAFSLVTYDRSHRSFRNFSAFLTRTMASAFDARPHWGKHFDLPSAQLRALYPKFERFRRIRGTLDPKGQFSNSFIDDLMSTGKN